MQQDNCPICASTARLSHRINTPIWDCPRCGKYMVAADVSPRQNSAEQRSVLSHFISKQQEYNPTEVFFLGNIELKNILKNTRLPTPTEQANNLILFLGKVLARPSDNFITWRPSPDEAKNLNGLIGITLGSPDEEFNDKRFLIETLKAQGLVDNSYGNPTIGAFGWVRLTFKGWQKYEELKHSTVDSRKAFVAMEFYDEKKVKGGKDYTFQQKLFPEYLTPAVKQTGFDLSNPLSAEPKAGNIHARLEAEIRASRFIIVELSHHNNGAYWEAGFAKGLGKPVIYMYNAKIGENNKPHFDVGSDYIIFWNDKTNQAIAEELKGIIRATLPDAKMID